jgi:hypothetical protein
MSASLLKANIGEEADVTSEAARRPNTGSGRGALSFDRCQFRKTLSG